MAFKYQKLTKEDAEYINSFKIPYPYGGGEYLMEFDDEDSILIDCENKMYYINAGGQGRMNSSEYPPTVAYLIMEDKVIMFTYYYMIKQNKLTNTNHYIYSIKTIYVKKIKK
ncbi:MAG: hypothetical protein CSB15_01800 [Clostridiales bacterium]|nr:MAG: hypothetical protein CSB15_01800 [Clostridiales bacterium]